MKSSKKQSFFFFLVAMMAFAILPWTASAYVTWSGSTPGSGNCASCHGDFNSGTYFSFTSDDGVSWGTDLMSGHRTAYGINCSECHRDASGAGRFPVYLNPASDPDGDSVGLGCVGCHGRIEDATAGDSIGIAANNWGDGLRAHHASAGVTICGGCHFNDSVQVGEQVPPETYAALGIDPCDENGDAAGSGNFGNLGLDNDGDGPRDGNDLPDCGDPCGNGVLDDGEECDPSVEGTQCCNSDCTFNTGDPCEDDDLCTTGDTCDAGACMPGTPLACEDDGNPCTFLECDPQTGNCTITSPEDAGTACGDPSDTECDNPDSCDGAGNCLDNLEASGVSCGDPSDTDCDNPDTCDGAGSCLANLEDSGVSCGDPSDTDCDNPDSCDGSGTCLDNLEAPGTSCDNGMFCDGADACDGAGACQSAGDPCDPATETCNEETDTCDPVQELCGNGSLDDGEECDDGNTMDGDCCSSSCQFEASGSACGDSSDTDCDNPDTCDGAGSCLENLEASGVSCGDPSDTDCDNPDSCDGSGTCLDNLEASGTSCDNGMFCDGADTCDGAGACQNAGDPCDPATETCNEETDTCDPVQELCGNGSVDDGEECDDGNLMDGDCCSATCQFEASGSACGDASDTDCDNPDTCDGAGSCLENLEASGVSCGDPSDTDCDNPDTCDGAGSCLENLEASGVSCGDPSDTDCDNPDSCDGSGTCLDNLEDSGTSCDNGMFCDGADTCDGAGACQSAGDPCDPATETCNEETDTCDPTADLCAGFVPETTSCGVGECAATGMTTCDPATGEIGDSCVPGTPSDEVCDGLDNDCDSTVDNDIATTPTTCGVGECAAEGVMECQDGTMVDTCVPGTPADELCNELDDDCDGEIDEDFADKGMACTVGVGVCEAEGVYVCKTDCSGLVCDAVPGEPGVEGPVDDPTCSDGMDNDCDGHTDLDDADCLDECDVVRAEVEAACPADHPWRNHGKYVSCASRRVSRAVCDGRIDYKCAGEIVRDYARSDVGKKDKDDKSDDPSDDDGDNGDNGDDDWSNDDDKGKPDKDKPGNNKNKDKAKAKSYDDDYCPADDIRDDDDHIVVGDHIHVVGVVTNGGLVVLTDTPAFGSVHLVQAGEPGYPGDLDLPDHAIVLEYTIENIPIGATAQVTIDFPSGVTDPAVYKIVNGELREIDVVIGSDDTLTFTVTDGGWLDEDNAANGKIVDPVVIGQAASVSTRGITGGGGGGCALGMGASPADMLSLAAPLLLLLSLKRRK